MVCDLLGPVAGVHGDSGQGELGACVGEYVDGAGWGSSDNEDDRLRALIRRHGIHDGSPQCGAEGVDGLLGTIAVQVGSHHGANLKGDGGACGGAVTRVAASRWPILADRLESDEHQGVLRCETEHGWQACKQSSGVGSQRDVALPGWCGVAALKAPQPIAEWLGPRGGGLVGNIAMVVVVRMT